MGKVLLDLVIGRVVILSSMVELENRQTKDWLVHQLDRLDIQTRPMFGSFGFYLSGRFFAIVADGKIYFKTNPITAGKYLDAGMSFFQPSPMQGLKNYCEVPPKVLKNWDELAKWASEAAGLTK